MRKIVENIIAIAVVVLAVCAFVAFNLGWFDSKDKGLKIEKTANVVTEINKISEFTSACFYEEIILKESKASDNVANKVAEFLGKKDALCTDEIVIIAKGKVRAGFDLKKVKEEDIAVNDGVLSVTLPNVEILDVVVNPSDFDIYIEDGTWSQEQVMKIEQKAASKLKADAIKEGVLKKAQDAGIKKLTEIFKSLGFKEVQLTVKA